MRFSPLRKLVVAIVMSCCASAAFAQYVWLNDKGVKQYSDQPPPPSVPNSKILKTPRGVVTQSEPAAGNTDADTDAAKKSASPSLADKNAEFEKRRTEQAEKDKKAADKAKQDADRKQNCERARDYLRALDSGERINRMNQSGEREYLSDEDRIKEAAETKRSLANCK